MKIFLLKTLIIVSVIILSCWGCTGVYTIRSATRLHAWVLMDYSRIPNGHVIHNFVSIDGKFGNEILFDSLICQMYDTIIIKRSHNGFYIYR